MPESAHRGKLRALEDGEIHPVGGVKPIIVDVRVIAATNADVPAKIVDGSFRQDLFFPARQVRGRHATASAQRHRGRLARISHGPVRNAHGVPIRHWRVGASREGFRPGKLLSKQLATSDLLTS